MILLPIALASAGLLGLAVWKRKHDAAAVSTTTPAQSGPGAPGAPPGGGGSFQPYGVEEPLPCSQTAQMIAIGQPKEAAILLQRCKAGIAPVGWSSCDQAAQMIAIGQLKEAAILFDRCRRGIPAPAPVPIPTGGGFWRAHHTGATSAQQALVQNAVGFIANAHHAYGQGVLDGAASTMTGLGLAAITEAARVLSANPNAAGASVAAQNAATAMVGAVQNFYARWKLYNTAASYGSGMVPVQTWELWTGGLAGALRLADDAIYQLQVAAAAPEPARMLAHAQLPGALQAPPRHLAPLGHLGLPLAPSPASFSAPR